MENKLENPEINAVSPEQLLVVFSRGRILLWMGVAVLIHVGVIGVTSVGYIRDHWIDPEGAKARKETVAAALEAEKARMAPAVRPAPPAASAVAATNSPASVPAPAAATNAPGATAGDEAAQLAARRGTKVVKRITEAASSNEIPQKPDLGILLEDTNPR
ncbi:MAG: hypothetical protein WCG36_03275 [bacterium]